MKRMAWGAPKGTRRWYVEEAVLWGLSLVMLAGLVGLGYLYWLLLSAF